MGVENPTSTPQQLTACDGRDGTLTVKDALNDAELPYVDITSAVLVIEQDKIGVLIKLVDIPKLLTLNNASNEMGELEYQWKVRFDVDCDNSNVNDVELYVNYHKQSRFQYKADITPYVQSYAMFYDENSKALNYSEMGLVDVSSEFLFDVDYLYIRMIADATNEAVAAINDKTPVYVETYYSQTDEGEVVVDVVAP